MLDKYLMRKRLCLHSFYCGLVIFFKASQVRIVRSDQGCTHQRCKSYNLSCVFLKSCHLQIHIFLYKKIILIITK